MTFQSVVKEEEKKVRFKTTLRIGHLRQHRAELKYMSGLVDLQKFLDALQFKFSSFFLFQSV